MYLCSLKGIEIFKPLQFVTSWNYKLPTAKCVSPM